MRGGLTTIPWRAATFFELSSAAPLIGRFEIQFRHLCPSPESIAHPYVESQGSDIKIVDLADD